MKADLIQSFSKKNCNPKKWSQNSYFWGLFLWPKESFSFTPPFATWIGSFSPSSTWLTPHTGLEPQIDPMFNLGNSCLNGWFKLLQRVEWNHGEGKFLWSLLLFIICAKFDLGHCYGSINPFSKKIPKVSAPYYYDFPFLWQLVIMRLHWKRFVFIFKLEQIDTLIGGFLIGGKLDWNGL